MGFCLKKKSEYSHQTTMKTANRPFQTCSFPSDSQVIRIFSWLPCWEPVTTGKTEDMGRWVKHFPENFWVSYSIQILVPGKMPLHSHLENQSTFMVPTQSERRDARLRAPGKWLSPLSLMMSYLVHSLGKREPGPPQHRWNSLSFGYIQYPGGTKHEVTGNISQAWS